jgi:hypothetical protein
MEDKGQSHDREISRNNLGFQKECGARSKGRVMRTREMQNREMIWVIQLGDHVAADKLNHDFTFQRFQHGARHEAPSPEMSMLIRVVDAKGHVSPNPSDRNFTTRRFQHGTQCEFTKRKIAKCLRVGPMITAHSHMEAGP